VKKQLCLIFVGLLGAMAHRASFAEPALQNSTVAPAASSAPAKTNERSSAKIAKDCDDEWRANRETMMKGGMTEDVYVQQCSLRNDVPAIAPDTTIKTAPSSAPK
jgi:hypothetical protein